MSDNTELPPTLNMPMNTMKKTIAHQHRFFNHAITVELSVIINYIMAKLFVLKLTIIACLDFMHLENTDINLIIKPIRDHILPLFHLLLNLFYFTSTV